MTHPFEPAIGPDLVIRGGMALTMVEGAPPVQGARVSISGGRIIEVRSEAGGEPSPEGAETLDARGGLIMPGLVNGHTHAAMTLFRGYADDLPLRTWLFAKIFPLEARILDPDSVYWGALLACLEMISSGTTALSDGYFFQDATARAVHRAGLRAVVAQGVIDFPAPGVPDPGRNLIQGMEFLDQWKGVSPLITPGLFCHSPLTCSDRTMRQALELSQSHSVPLQIHLSESAEEAGEILKRTGVRPVRHLADIGLLSPGLICAHSIHLEGEEMSLLAEHAVKVVHVPESNMKLSAGVAKVSDMLKMGITVALGTDGCASNNDLDLFREMDSAAKLSKVFEVNPVCMDAPSVLRMATRGGADALGLSGRVGTLEPGKEADIIVVDLQQPHLVPLYNPYSSLVYSACGADVRHTVVRGRVLMRDRRFLTLDAEEIMGRVGEIGRKVRKSQGG